MIKKTINGFDVLKDVSKIKLIDLNNYLIDNKIKMPLKCINNKIYGKILNISFF